MSETTQMDLPALAREIAEKTYTGGNLAFRDTLAADIVAALRTAQQQQIDTVTRLLDDVVMPCEVWLEIRSKLAALRAATDPPAPEEG